jgi:dynein heavy chain 1
MKDFPLNELLAATDLDKIQDSLVLIFAHINKKLKLSPYPIRRALPLVEAISRDLNDQLARVLSSLRLMYLEHDQFEKAMAAAATVFQTWDESIKEFTNVAREVTRKRSEKFIPIKIAPAHAKLQSRITYLRQFRKQHEQLRQMLSPTRGLIGQGMIELNKTSELADGINGQANGFAELEIEEEVRLAYEAVKGVDVLDITDEGTEIWIAAESTYNEKVSRVENQIIGQLREHLGAARNAAAMFRVFSKFNALFVRPRIRGAIQEWQTQLIESVKDDIRRLQDKFKTSYRVRQVVSC